jgi:hypothetical protein
MSSPNPWTNNPWCQLALRLDQLGDDGAPLWPSPVKLSAVC